MTDLFKDIIKAWEERVRSPFLGSIGIAFVACNWKPIFFLLFSGEPALARFAFFDSNTSSLTLFWNPLCIGFLLTLAIPWLKFMGALIAKAPTILLNSLQGDLASERRIHAFKKAADEEQEKARLEAAQEQRKIDAAKRLEEAKSIGDDDVVDELLNERETNSLRSDQKRRLNEIKSEITTVQKAILMMIGDVDSGGISLNKIMGNGKFRHKVSKVFNNPTSTRLQVEAEAGLTWLKKQNLVTEQYDNTLMLTKDGYEVYDWFKNEF